MSFKVVSVSTHPMPYDRDGFRKLGVDFIQKPAKTDDTIIALASDADVLVTQSEPITKTVIENLKSCRLIFTAKGGYDNIDVNAATEHGICVANIPNYSIEEVSDHAMALLLACARKIVVLDNFVRHGQWKTFHGPEIQAVWRGISAIRGRTLGLVGFGKIVKSLIPKAKGFGLNIVAYDPYITQSAMNELGVKSVSFEQLLKESDFVSVHARLTPENRHMIGLDQLRQMKPTAFLINTSRGALVDEGALYIALSQGYIAGAGLDVLEKEPVAPENPLLKLDNVIITGHSGHYSDSAWQHAGKSPVEQVIRIMSGQWPEGLINPEVKEKFIARWGNLNINNF